MTRAQRRKLTKFQRAAARPLGSIPLRFYLALADLAEMHDQYLSDHSHGVAILSVELGARVGLSREHLRMLEAGALVHDIGKTGISDTIINKATLLNATEREMVEAHPMRGYRLLAKYVPDHYVLNVVLYHHENWDGSGYPHGLKDNQIPLSARILRLADTWDAMTANRAYRPARTAEQGIEELLANKGNFDPRLLEKFIRMIQEHGEPR